MATPAQISEQVELERESIRQGLKKLQDNTRRLEEKSYASASVYGISSIDALMGPLVERIKETNSRIHERKNGVAFKEISQFLADVEPLAAAAIALKLTFDKVFGYRDKSNLLVNVTEAVGHAIEDECQIRFYEKEAPGLLEVLKKNYWHRSCGTQQKVVIIRTLMNRYDIEWKTWGRVNRIKLGGWLLDCIMQVSGWFEKEMRQEGKSRVNYVVPTPAYLAIKDQVMADAELFAPLAWPMLIEPNDWAPGRAGGYLLNEVMRGHDMVRRGNQGCIQGERIYSFLNHLQKVSYRINPFIYGVAKELQERGVKVGKFIPIVDLPLPPKPADIAENYDSRKDYRRRAAEVRNTNAHSFKASCRTRMTMETAAIFHNKERFFIPWSCDYRGRAYPIPAFLTPQDTDFGKSMIRFADESYMTPEAEDWLAFQVATTSGLDKSTMQERLDWTRSNHELISQVAMDPLSNLPQWEGVEEPWQFLAACEEYNACVIQCTRQFTGLMVATDATCSGLQILAGLARDKNTAKLVNVLPTDTPQDAYKVVAEAATPHCPESIQPYMDRKVVKRVVMTVPYNAKPYSNRGYIRDALKEKGVEISKEDLTATVKAVRNAMYNPDDDTGVVPGPMAVMDWIEKEIAALIKRGVTEIEWITPSGFVVHQRLMKKQVERIQLQLLGKCELRVATDDTDEVDINRHKAATAPNLIHSLDASLLHLAFARFSAPFSVIHDSVLCRATDMSILSTVVRETYMHLFAEHDYLRDWAKQIGALREPPIIGDLEPSSVIDSTYFFC
jgi:DNA-directed RNA polymerase